MNSNSIRLLILGFISFLIILGQTPEFFCLEPPLTPNLRKTSDAEVIELEKLHHKAEDCILKNDFQNAIRIYNDIILQEPDDDVAYTGLGQCYLVTGEFGRAKMAYMNALHINPDNQTALAGLKKIENPDSLNFTEEYIAQIPVPPDPQLTESHET